MPPDIQNFDLFLSGSMRSLQNQPLDIATHILTGVTYGGALWVVLAIFLWKRGYKLLALQIGLALALALVETSMLKHLFHRERPMHIEFYEFWLPMHKLFADGYSFPSGHTSMSFAAAGAIFLKFRGRLGWLSLVLAMIVGISRIYEGMHWPTDVFAGVLVGLLASYTSILITRKFRTKLVDV